MGRLPYLSIAIPTFRRPHRLAGLLDLLVQQQGVQEGDLEVVVLDNHSDDATPQVVGRYRDQCSFVRYHCHERNMGGERNFHSALDLAAGEYVWILPDDDRVADVHTVARVIARIRSYTVPPAFVIVNARSFHVETNEIVKERFNPIRGDLYLSDGRDILTVVSDLDLIGLQRLIFRRDVFPDPFLDDYMRNPEYVTCVVMSLVACTKGPALYLGEPHALFGEGDPTPWRAYWPHIALQLLPELLLRSVGELGYAADAVSRILLVRKHEQFRLILPPQVAHVLVFQLYDVSWLRMARLYGCAFVLSRIAAYLPIAVRKALALRRLVRFMGRYARSRSI